MRYIDAREYRGACRPGAPGVALRIYCAAFLVNACAPARVQAEINVALEVLALDPTPALIHRLMVKCCGVNALSVHIKALGHSVRPGHLLALGMDR